MEDETGHFKEIISKTAKDEMISGNFKEEWHRLMKPLIESKLLQTYSNVIQFKAHRYQCREVNSGGFSDRVEWILARRSDAFSLFHQFPRTKYSDCQRVWIKHNPQL
jgi:hypothetical protein